MQKSPIRDRKKRDRSSEGETPKPEQKHNKMADEMAQQKASSTCVIPPDISQQLKILITSVEEIKKNQDGMKRTLESKMDRLKNDLMESIETKMKVLKDELSLDIARESARLDEVLISIQSIENRLSSVENVCAEGGGISSDAMDHTGYQPRDGLNSRFREPLDNPDLTVIATNIPFSIGENLSRKVTDLIHALGEEVSDRVTITGVRRLPAKYRNKPGLVKISFRNLDEKILVLRNKRKLMDSQNFKRVFLKSSKSHAERLIELNARTLLQALPTGKSYRVDANGRIKSRGVNQERDDTDGIETSD